MEIQIFDNGGKTHDRYCMIIDNRYVYTVAADPKSFQSVRYLCDALDLDRKEAGKLIDLKDLPPTLTRLIEDIGRYFFEKAHGHMDNRRDKRVDCKAPIALPGSSKIKPLSAEC